jgi:hypothetical protein
MGCEFDLHHIYEPIDPSGHRVTGHEPGEADGFLRRGCTGWLSSPKLVEEPLGAFLADGQEKQSHA